jgi:polyisoprenoid-binding protein YceI
MTRPANTTATAHTLAARVVDGTGWPVPSAVLTLTDLRGTQVARAFADGTGAVQAPGLPSGSYTMVVTAPDHQPLARSVRVGSGDVALGELVLPAIGGTPLPEPGEWDIDPVHSSIQLTVRHLGIASIHGRLTEFGGTAVVADPIDDSRVTAVMQTASLDTGNADRDAHLRTADFLDVDNHPTITFVSSGLVRLGGPDRWAIDGDLTIRGTTRPVRLDTTYLGAGPDPWGGQRCGFTAATELRRDDFAVDWNQAVRIGVAAISTNVRITLDIELVRR